MTRHLFLFHQTSCQTSSRPAPHICQCVYVCCLPYSTPSSPWPWQPPALCSPSAIRLCKESTWTRIFISATQTTANYTSIWSRSPCWRLEPCFESSGYINYWWRSSLFRMKCGWVVVREIEESITFEIVEKDLICQPAGLSVYWLLISGVQGSGSGHHLKMKRLICNLTLT